MPKGTESKGTNREVIDVPASGLDEVVELLSEAFCDYAVMRYVIGAGEAGYDRRLRRLVRLFTETRYVRGGVVLAAVAGTRWVAAACIDKPESLSSESSNSAPSNSLAEVEALRAEAWEELGEGARSRYEDYGVVSATFRWPSPHYHLGMIGVPPAERGRGHARPLLEAVHELSDASSSSRGCSLTTENERNLSFYEHFGYRVIGEGRSGGLASWGLFRETPETLG